MSDNNSHTASNASFPPSDLPTEALAKEGWVETNLGEVVKTNISSIGKDFEFDEILYLDTGSITENRIESLQKYSISEAPSRAKRLVKENDIIYSTVRPNQKHFGFIENPEENLVVSTGFTVISAIENKADPKFLYYFLTQDQITNTLQQTAEHSTSTYPSIRPEHIESLEFSLPPLPEQQAIASVLSTFDDKIELLREQNNTLEEMGQVIFQEKCLNHDFKDLHDEHDEKKSSNQEHQVNQGSDKGWRVGKIEDIFDFLEGPGIRNWQYTESGTRFINIRLIQNGDILVENSNFISKEEANGKYKHFLLNERDFVLSTSGTLGRGAIVRKEHLPLMLNTSVIRFRPKDEISYGFMYLFLQSSFFIHELESLASGSVQLNFGPMHLRQIEMMIPNNEILEKFSETVNPIFQKMSDNFSQIQSLARSRDELLPRLMSGEVRVEF
jgi:type I restriction enzyme, S subunit